MKFFVPARHAAHAPVDDYSDGIPPFPHHEVPSRLERVLAGIRRLAGAEIRTVEAGGPEHVLSIHDADYVEFLESLCADLKPGEQFIPTLFGNLGRDVPMRFAAGKYARDIGSPLGPESFAAALDSAECAVAAAGELAESGGPVAALCRPPGHHAGKRRYGGYCYFNNAGVAARALRDRGLRPALLDLDYHLGDGSVEFAAADSPYYSLHADPVANYPYVDSAWLSRAEHCTFHPLEEKAGPAAYLDGLAALMEKITDFGPDVLIVSIGFDVLSSDYIQDAPVDLQIGDLSKIADVLAECGLPLLHVLEGGYDPDSLEAAAFAYFGRFTGSGLQAAEARG